MRLRGDAIDVVKGSAAARRTSQAYAFVHASRLGHALAPCGKQRLRVELPTAALPSPPPDAAAFAGGGRVIVGGYLGCRSRVPLTLAWAANLLVLLAGVVWVVYGLLFAFPDDEEGGLGEVGAFKEERLGRFRSELGTAFALSLLLSWGVKDVIAPLVIACLPLQSSRGMWVARILNGVLGFLAP